MQILMYVVLCSVVSYLQSGRTPVYTASWKGHTAVVELLIENGADISICEEVCSLTIIIGICTKLMTNSHRLIGMFVETSALPKFMYSAHVCQTCVCCCTLIDFH